MREQIKLESSWLKHLEADFSKPYMLELKKFLKERYIHKAIIYPEAKNFFAALDLTPVDQVKVVILGQDPYHGPGQAHGLSFSVPAGVALPPSLQNIYKELASDLGVSIPKNGCLTSWAQQGVLLLNSVLSVESGQAASHQGKGWELFTDSVIRCVNDVCDHVVFILWGSYAQKKAGFVNSQKHFVIKSAHPSPLSSYRGFFGSKPFSKANDFLKSHSIQPIDWSAIRDN